MSEISEGQYQESLGLADEPQQELDDEPPRALVPAPVTTPRALVLQNALQEEAEQRRILLLYVRDHMVSGKDFGVIPGTQRPTLLKPGAEKLTDLYRCTARLAIDKELEDWDKPLFVYRFRCEMISRDSGAVLAVGYGSCNSREGRYRWRDAQRKCPECDGAFIIQGKPEYGGGWICFKKKGGCGAKFSSTDQAIVGQVVGKVENEDVFTLVNTILKMAEKRAHVDAAIRLARCADIFTQDVEDLADYGSPPPPSPKAPPDQDSPGEAPSSSSTTAAGGGDLSNEQVEALIPLAETFVNARRLAEKAAAYRFPCLKEALKHAIELALGTGELEKLVRDFQLQGELRELARARYRELGAGRAA